MDDIVCSKMLPALSPAVLGENDSEDFSASGARSGVHGQSVSGHAHPSDELVSKSKGAPAADWDKYLAEACYIFLTRAELAGRPTLLAETNMSWFWTVDAVQIPGRGSGARLLLFQVRLNVGKRIEVRFSFGIIGWPCMLAVKHVEGGIPANGWFRSLSNQPSQTVSSLGDSSAPLFSMYSNIVKEEDNGMAERWQKDAQTILIFDLRPNVQDTSAFYLQNIYQLLAASNTPDAEIPFPFANPQAFSPPTYAIWVNSLWFLSMALSLSSALLATLLHQWAGRYIRVTRPSRSSPHKRAPFFANGVHTLHTTFSAIVVWVAFSASTYGCITLMPIFRHDSPYYAPLSATAWFIYTGILYAIFKILCFIPDSRDTVTPGRFRDTKNRYRRWFLGGVEKAAEDTAFNRSSEVDGRVIQWTIASIDDDDAMERFFAAIPGFCRSREVRARPPSLIQIKMRQTMDEFLDYTLTSESISETIKISRLAICLNAANEALGSFVISRILGNLFDGRWRGVHKSVEMGHSLLHWCNSADEWIALTSRSLVASIIATQERDNRWVALARAHFRLPDRVLRDNIPHGDSVLLLILLHVARNLLDSVLPPWDSSILRLLSQFDIHNTLPELQSNFCMLWNEIVREARNSQQNSIPVFILREIRHLYTALHEASNSPSSPHSPPSPTAYGEDNAWYSSSYPSCNVTGHLLDPTPHVHRQTPHTSAASFPFAPQSDIALVRLSPPSRRSAPPSPVLNRGITNPLAGGPSSGDVFESRRSAVPLDTSPRAASLESQASPAASLDIRTANSSPFNTDISATRFVANPTPRSTSRDGVPSPKSKETTIDLPIVSGSTPPPIPISALSSSSGAIPVRRPSTVASTPPQSDAVPHARGSSPTPSLSPPTADLHLTSQIATVLDTHVTTSTETSSVQHDTRDPSSLVPMEVSRHPHPSASADDLTSRTPRSSA
ncbi:hypothetical protein F5148DRAFT_1149632 [Russula earlei]|uniref:Uncharacterized protein n=1 Tax=Russula earlei TaxID=71964 RepID=A0ACC0U9V1_9AGAM|nr:hypothetical protein F5148DRAFT_1149632 [Russula earlei]